MTDEERNLLIFVAAWLVVALIIGVITWRIIGVWA